MPEQRAVVRGSRRVAVAGATRAQPVDRGERVEATILVRRAPAARDPSTSFGAHVGRSDFAAAHGANAGELALVERFARDQALTVVASHADRRTVQVAGSAEAVQAAFGTELSYYDSPAGRYRGRVGELTLPVNVATVVDAVLGLDNRPIAKPHFRRYPHPEAATAALWPTQVAKAYNFPTSADGTGETIGIIELGGGFNTQDLATYFASPPLGLKKSPTVSAVSVDGGANTPGKDTDADAEVMLDIELAGVVASGARIVVYFAPNTDQGFHDALTTAVHDNVNTPSVISISWGGAEANWTSQAMTAMDAALQDAGALGVTVAVASGDDGSTDGLPQGNHVDFPASSSFALACGGTTLTLSASGTIAQEVVWNDQKTGNGATGGGFSTVFARPDYQNASNAKSNAMRGVPDVAANADPLTGFHVLVDGVQQVIGGTSAAAPLWAGLIALLNQRAHQARGFLNPFLYTNAKSAFHDITVGNNGSFKAASGWDPTTGLGTPNGTALAAAGVTT